MNKKQYTLLIVIIVAILLVAATVGYFYYGKINFLISGVPYHGIYTLFFSHASSSQIASILEILGYWGDTRFNSLDLKEKFQLYRNNSAVFEAGSTLKSPTQIKSETESFF